jgi:hypothetical protein
MSQHDDRPPTSAVTADGQSGQEDSASLPERSPSAWSSTITTWLLVLAGGLLAGLAGFALGETAPKIVAPSFDLSEDFKKDRNAMRNELERRMKQSYDRSAALAYGGLGMVLGLTLGVAGGLARRSLVAAMAAGLVGLVLGAVAGAGSTTVLVPYYNSARAAATDANYNEDLGTALRTHGGIWLTIGAAAGLALGIGLGNRGRIARSIAGGIAGAILAAVIYEFGGAVLFPLAETFRPTSIQMLPRLFAHLTVALCVAVGALLFANHMTFRRPSSQAYP